MRIEDVERPVVGETYLVPTLDGMPVVGRPHVDNDHFQCAERHWHYDSRFLPEGKERTVHRMKDYEPTHQPHVCLHADVVPWPEGNFAGDYLQGQAPGIARMALYLGHADKRAVCGICPHKGMPIHNGVCSAHRLKWLPDGTIAHKPPYTLRIRNSMNEAVYESLPDDSILKIDLEYDCDPNLGTVVDCFDRDGTLIAWHDFGGMYGWLRKGDILKISPRECVVESRQKIST